MGDLSSGHSRLASAQLRATVGQPAAAGQGDKYLHTIWLFEHIHEGDQLQRHGDLAVQRTNQKYI